MDWILATGGIAMISIGLSAKFRSDLLWRLYSYDPRWRKENPEKPENWSTTASRQGNFFIGFGVISIILSIVLVQVAVNA